MHAREEQGGKGEGVMGRRRRGREGVEGWRRERGRRKGRRGDYTER